jgi:hypothetical protein
MSQTELEARIRYLERMRFMVGRQQLSDDLEIERAEIELGSQPTGPNPTPDGSPLVPCDGFCQAPAVNMLYDAFFEFWPAGTLPVNFTLGTRTGTWSGSGTLTFVNRPITTLQGAFPRTFPQYWHSPSFEFTYPGGWASGSTYYRFFGACFSPSWFIVNWYATPGLTSLGDLSDLIIFTDPPDTSDRTSTNYTRPTPDYPAGVSPSDSLARLCPFDYTYVMARPSSTFYGPWRRTIRVYRSP